MTLLGRAGDSARPPDIHTNTTKIRSVILSLLYTLDANEWIIVLLERVRGTNNSVNELLRQDLLLSGTHQMSNNRLMSEW